MLSMVSKKIVEVEGSAPKLKKSATPSAKFVKGFDIKKNKLIELPRSMQQLASANKTLGQFKKTLTECATSWADAAGYVVLGSNMLKGR